MRKEIRFGIIGLGLMGKELASAAARYGHLLTNGPVPVITGVCNRSKGKDLAWFTENVPGLKVVTSDYRELIGSPDVDAV